MNHLDLIAKMLHNLETAELIYIDEMLSDVDTWVDFVDSLIEAIDEELKEVK